MKKTILFFLLLLFAVWIGLFIHQNTGSLFIVLKDWTIEMPLWFAVVSLILVYFVTFILFKILGKLFHLGHWLQHWKSRLQKRYALLHTRRGLIEFGEGNWKQAERHLTKTLPKDGEGDIFLLNYLAAARAAQELGAPARRDEYLREAQKAIPDAKIAIELTQAQLQIVNEQWEQALATLNHLHSLSPYHPYVMKLLVKVYLSLKDWKNLQEWLPDIRNKKIMNEKDLLRLENEVYSGLLEQEAKQVNLESLKTLWESFPKAARRNSYIVAIYITQLLEHKAYDDAELECREALKHEWNDSLIALYGECETSHIEDQLRFAEQFLKYHPNNSYLLLTLGRICMRRQLWGKAKDYFSKSAHMHPDAQTYAELAKLSEILHDNEMANAYYKKSIELALASIRKSQTEDIPTKLDNFYCLAGKVF